MKKKNLIPIITYAILIVLIYIFTPIVFEGYSLRMINYGLFAAILVYGISILLGMGGQLSFASISFMGVGAYVVANLCSEQWGIHMATPLALVLAVLLSALLGFLLGLVLFKLSGTYFTFATIAVVSVAYAFFLNYKPLFGGAEGISKIDNFHLFGVDIIEHEQWFIILFTLTILVALLVERIRRTQLGRSLASIRDNETAAKTFGVNTYITKVYAFTIAAALAGLSGALYAFQGNYAVSDLFTYNNATQYIIMAMLGGVNSTVGVLVGSMLVKIVPEVFRAFDSFVQLFWGVAIILLMIFMPDGFAGLAKAISRKIKYSKKNAMKKEESHGTNFEA